MVRRRHDPDSGCDVLMLHRAHEKGVGGAKAGGGREFRVRRVELGCLLDVLAGRMGL